MSTNKKPLISVLLPVYNAEPFLARTLDSILYQTYDNFEIIAINDGSTDNSLRVLNEYAKSDDRIKVVDQENVGLVKTLNRAASLASGEFLARMDSDDLCLPRRFELQIAAFENHPEAVLCGGCFDVMNEDDEIIYHEAVPTKNDELKRALFVRNPIAHGSAMFKKSAFEATTGYSDECGPTEDYDLWTRLIKQGDIIGVPATIFRWRINPGGITQSKADTMAQYMNKNLQKFMANNKLEVTSRSYLVKRGWFYVDNYELHGVGMKETMLKDCIGVAILFLKQKKLLKGILQIFIVMSTGRTGVRLAIDRFKNTTKHHISRLN